MNVYIWEGPGVLSDYSDGLIVVCAESLETALKQIHEKDDCCNGCFPALPTRTIEAGEPFTCINWGGS
jgi:hypothetical protein